MAVNAKLLEILRCPVSQRALVMLNADRLEDLNQAIDAGEIAFVGGERVTERLEQALITEDDGVIYPIVDQLPAMLPERGIGTAQMNDF